MFMKLPNGIEILLPGGSVQSVQPMKELNWLLTKLSESRAHYVKVQHWVDTHPNYALDQEVIILLKEYNINTSKTTKSIPKKDDYNKYVGKTSIHCPDCAEGNLRALPKEEAKKWAPNCRAGDVPERAEYGFAKPEYILVVCDICKHYHEMDVRSLNSKYKPRTVKIKEYGVHHRRD